MLFSAFSLKPLLLFYACSIALASPIVPDIEPIEIEERQYTPPPGAAIGPPALIDIDNTGTPVPKELGGRDAEACAGEAEAFAEFEKIQKRQSTNDQREGLRLHNEIRAKKGVPPLVWDSALEATAKVWADEIARLNKLQHATVAQRQSQGENLAYQKSTVSIPNPIGIGTKMWIAEEPKYKNETIPNGDFMNYGHYTQVVWRTTTKVGIATSVAADGGLYSVARYYPPGNIAKRTPWQ